MTMKSLFEIVLFSSSIDPVSPTCSSQGPAGSHLQYTTMATGASAGPEGTM
jgi:hypothetical protein